MFKLLILLLGCSFGLTQPMYDRAYLPNVNALTFNKGEMTTYRRTHPVPALKCRNGLDKYGPSVVRCYNRGVDDTGNVAWECEAQLGSRYKLGKTKVSCEGFADASDPWILSGSCGLEYDLELTSEGKAYHDRMQMIDMNRGRHTHTGYNVPDVNNGVGYGLMVFGFGIISVCLILGISSYNEPKPKKVRYYDYSSHYSGVSDRVRPSSVPLDAYSNKSFLPHFNMRRRIPPPPPVVVPPPRVVIPPPPIVMPPPVVIPPRRYVPSPTTPPVVSPPPKLTGNEVKTVKAYATTENR